MLDWLIDLYRGVADAFVVVAHPAARDAIAARMAGFGVRFAVTAQNAPTGMLDAVILGCEAAETWNPARVWVTWCDQIAVHPQTVARLASAEDRSAMAFPVVTRTSPYIHFERDAAGLITAVRQRREGDEMPAEGESDMGLFSLSGEAAGVDLLSFAAEAASSSVTGERNFLPFIPWLAARRPVVTIPSTDAMEAVGINTPEELEHVAEYLRSR